jgi:O-antigen ligase
VWLSFLVILVILLVSGLGFFIAPGGNSLSEVAWRWMKQIIQLGLMLAFLVWIALWVQDEKRWQLTFRWLAAGLVFQLLYGLIQGYSFFQANTWFPGLEKVFTSNPAILSGSEQLHLDNQMVNIPRLRGTMCEPLYLGSYLLGVLPWLFIRNRKRTGPLLGLLGVSLLVLTWSRGAWLAGMAQIALATGIWAWSRRPQEGRWLSPRARLGLVAGLALVIVLALVPGSPLEILRQRMVQTFSQQDWSNLTRLYSMQAGWKAFLLSPLVGIGWGQYAYHFPLLVDPMGLQSQFTWPVVNNFPLMVLAETGLLGFVFLGFQSLRFLKRGWEALKTADGTRLHRVAAALVSVVGMSLQLLTFSQYNLPHLWALLGLALAALWGEGTDAGRAQGGEDG